MYFSCDEDGLFVQDIVKMLGEVRQLSPAGQLLRALSVVHLADLNSAVPSSVENQEKLIKSSLESYCSAQSILLQQVLNFSIYLMSRVL